MKSVSQCVWNRFLFLEREFATMDSIQDCLTHRSFFQVTFLLLLSLLFLRESRLRISPGRILGAVELRAVAPGVCAVEASARRGRCSGVLVIVVMYRI